MSFVPVLPAAGLAGWRFLQRTLPAQQESFAAAPQIQRDLDHFGARIGGIASAAELVTDGRLLKVALGAFGLQEDLPKRFFIRKVLEDGVARRDALANRLSDSRYRELSRAFGFGDGGVPRTGQTGFARQIAARYVERSFEQAVGRQDETMRLALNARRELAALAASPSSDDTKWYRIMGTPPLRRVMETALGLPGGFGQQDLDRQLATLRERSASLLGIGALSELAEPETLERTLRAFLLRAQAGEAANAVRGSTALTILQMAPRLAAAG